MKKSEYNKQVIENFILFFTHETREQATELTEAIDLYEALDNYIEEDHVDGIGGDEDGDIEIVDTDNFKFGSGWSKADIQGRAKEMDVTLTDAECKEIADNIERTHDANIGINWEVIDENIRYYKGL